jgi:hypothetical protein
MYQYNYHLFLVQWAIELDCSAVKYLSLKESDPGSNLLKSHCLHKSNQNNLKPHTISSNYFFPMIRYNDLNVKPVCKR